MELTIALVISILSITFTILNFAFTRKDKANKDTSNDAYAQGRIEEKLSNIEKSLTKIEDKLDNYDIEIKRIIKEEMKQHILEYHNK